MSRRLEVLLCFALLLLIHPGYAELPATQPATSYRNPFSIDIADPTVLRHDGLYWLYGTSARDGFNVWSSPDLVTWRLRGKAYERTRDGWGYMFFWAPCVIQHNDRFYLFYSARGKVANGDHLRICVATSDSPEGPFKDVKAPMLEIGQSVIDAEVFIDDDGQAYLYYVLDNSENFVIDPGTKKRQRQSHIYVVRLSDDLFSVVGEPVFCIKPEGGWEGQVVNEGPEILKHGSTYILMYSAREFFEPEYAVGYATARSPLGPWTKAPENPILQRTRDISGPGHHCVIESPDGRELFCVYHVHKNRVPGGDRQLAIDRMTVTEDSDGHVRVKIHGPTSTTQPAPSR